jgi:hypothetical protein
MSLLEGDSDKRQKLYNLLKKVGPFICFVVYVVGLVYSCLQPHEDIVHKTYMSENALSPGLANNDKDLGLINDFYKQIKSIYEK